jgi:hypothetical protein
VLPRDTQTGADIDRGKLDAVELFGGRESKVGQLDERAIPEMWRRASSGVLA